MIIWLNGIFGCGKTSTAAELHALIPSSRVFDPDGLRGAGLDVFHVALDASDEVLRQRIQGSAEA